MSGADIPYQLRPNKHVERQLFWELLDIVDKWKPVCEAGYISMGGRFLEDFRQMHFRFGSRKLLSIEQDYLTFRRQTYNKPIGPIKCLHKGSGEFVTHFETIAATTLAANNYIVWLDYAASNGRVNQLAEYQSLVSKLAPGDVIKITLNGSMQTFASRTDGEDLAAFQQRLMTKVKDKLNQYFPSDRGYTHQQFSGDGLAEVMVNAIRIAALEGVKGAPTLIIRPLSSFVYNDGHHDMVTVSAIVLDTSDAASFDGKTRYDQWDFKVSSWDKPIRIGIPDLSLKERALIDHELFCIDEEELHAKLPFSFAEDPQSSLQHFKQYVMHYRRYPAYVRVAS